MHCDLILNTNKGCVTFRPVTFRPATFRPVTFTGLKRPTFRPVKKTPCDVEASKKSFLVFLKSNSITALKTNVQKLELNQAISNIRS